MSEINEKYIRELSKKFSSKEAVLEEITRLNIELNLPKGTEHFLSDLHGEAEAFEYIMRSASGVIINKIELLFGGELGEDAQSKLATLIYYPEEILSSQDRTAPSYTDHITDVAKKLIQILKIVGEKYSKEYVNSKLSAIKSPYIV